MSDAGMKSCEHELGRLLGNLQFTNTHLLYLTHLVVHGAHATDVVDGAMRLGCNDLQYKKSGADSLL